MRRPRPLSCAVSSTAATDPATDCCPAVACCYWCACLRSYSGTRQQAARGGGGGGGAGRGGSAAAAGSASESGKLIAVIGDEETVTGFLLAGVGHRTVDGCNYLIVKHDTKQAVIEETFRKLTTRSDVCIILINQHVANEIRHLTNTYTQTIPTILEIPSKDHPYDPKQDFIMQRVNQMMGNGV